MFGMTPFQTESPKELEEPDELHFFGFTSVVKKQILSSSEVIF
jgi:hypothetical protein